MLNSTQIQRLLDIANVGCHNGYVYNARVIYDTVLTVKPDFAPAKIGLAFSHIVVDDFPVAEEILNAVLANNDDDIDAKVMLGLNLILAGESDRAHQILKPVSEDISTPAGKLAADLMAAKI